MGVDAVFALDKANPHHKPVHEQKSHPLCSPGAGCLAVDVVATTAIIPMVLPKSPRWQDAISLVARNLVPPLPPPIISIIA